MRKLFLIVFVLLFVFAMGCSGNSGVTPDERVSMEEFFAGLTYDDSVAGTFTVIDADGVILFEGDLLRADDGSLQLSEVRNGEIQIDFTWLNWIDCSVDYLNPAGFTPDGRSLYYIGTTMKYNLNVQNLCLPIYNATVKSKQLYLGGLYHMQLLPGDSTEIWEHQYLKHGTTVLYDEYYIPYGTHAGNDVTWVGVIVPFNFWWLQIELVLYCDAAGMWDP